MFELFNGLSWTQLWHVSGMLNFIELFLMMVISWVFFSDKHYFLGLIFFIDFIVSFYVAITWSSSMPIDYAMIWESVQWKLSTIMVAIVLMFFYRKKSVSTGGNKNSYA